MDVITESFHSTRKSFFVGYHETIFITIHFCPAIINVNRLVTCFGVTTGNKFISRTFEKPFANAIFRISFAICYTPETFPLKPTHWWSSCQSIVQTFNMRYKKMKENRCNKWMHHDSIELYLTNV